MKRIIRKIAHYLIPLFLRKKIWLLSLYFTDRPRYKRIRFYRKRNVSYGKKNRDKRFFVVRRDPKATGLLACYVCALGQLIEINNLVDSKKLIPVMDMFTQHYSLAHNASDGEMKVNAWEYYFKQFSNFTMEDVLESKNVTLGYGYENEIAIRFFHNNTIDKELINKYLPIHNKFFALTDSLKKRFEKDFSSLFGDKRVLGTNIREGYIVLANGRNNKEKAYKGEYIQGHPVQPTIDELCETLAIKMKDWGCDYIYAECQTTFIENKLSERFGNRFICLKRTRFKVNDLSYTSWIEAVNNRKNSSGFSMVENNVSYLESVFLLSKCTSIYAGKSSGTVVACFWNNDKYEHMEIIDKGVY